MPLLWRTQSAARALCRWRARLQCARVGAARANMQASLPPADTGSCSSASLALGPTRLVPPPPPTCGVGPPGAPKQVPTTVPNVPPGASASAGHLGAPQCNPAAGQTVGRRRQSLLLACRHCLLLLSLEQSLLLSGRQSRAEPLLTDK